jgi:formate dehydrogenase iron-sulfur subunit
VMKAILVDVTRCTGCETCVQACTEANQLPARIPARKLSADGLSSRRISAVVALSGGGFAKKQCLHCLEPGCVDACPVGAMVKLAEGPVVYDRDRCMGCRYCMLACPVGIPRYEWEETVPYVKKCELCHERLQRGDQPACVAACPNGALSFGDREGLLRTARQRLRQEPKRYLQHIYGEKELGGTSVLYVSNEPLEELGFPTQLEDRALASFTWPLISKTPWMAATVAGFLVATHFIVRRRMLLQAEAKRGPAVTPDGDGEEQ